MGGLSIWHWIIVLVVVRRQLHRAAGSRIARWAFGCRGLGRARHLRRKAGCAQSLGHLGQRAGRGVHAQLARAEAKRQPLHAGDIAAWAAYKGFDVTLQDRGGIETFRADRPGREYGR